MPSGAQDPLSPGFSKRHGSEGLLDFCRFCFDFDIRQRLRSLCALPIKSSLNPFCLVIRVAVSEQLSRIIPRSHVVLTAAELGKFRKTSAAILLRSQGQRFCAASC